MTIADLLKDFPPETEIQATNGTHYYEVIEAVRQSATRAVCLSLRPIDALWSGPAEPPPGLTKQ